MAKKSAKFILSIGDEGGILTYMQGKEVVRRLFAASSNYSDTRGFVELLGSDSSAPVYMLVDVMDQSYIQHTLPPVSPFTINNLIKRKMERDFSANDLKGALQIGREKEGRKDWKYLFVTLSQSQHLQSWLDMVMEQPNRFVGIYLLPVEAESFILRLREAVTGEKAGKKKKGGDSGTPDWQLLVAHNKVGGFRQVVLRGGKLIFARLAQPVGDNQPEVIAGNIEQEISVTIEYLKRLGYSDDQGMNVFVITSEAIKQSIDAENVQATSTYTMTPHDAALRMGFEAVTEPQDQFADVLMAASFATAKKHLLKLQTPNQENLSKLYTGIKAVKWGGIGITAAAVLAAGYYAFLIPQTSGEIEKFEQQTRMAEQELEEVKEQEKSLPDNLDKMTDLVALHQQLNNLGIQPLAALEHFSQSREGYTVMLSNVDWSVTNTIVSGAAQNTRGGNPDEENAETMELTLEMDMYGTEVGTQRFDEMVEEYTKKLEAAFAGYTVELTSDRPGMQDKTTDFVLGEDEIDPILEMPFYPLTFDISGAGPAETEGEQADGAVGTTPGAEMQPW